MKRTTLLAGLALGLTTLATAPAAAQLAADDVPVEPSGPWGPGVYMRQALSRGMEVARDVALRGNYRLDNTRTCILGALLEEGETVAMNYDLQAGERLAFVGGGDEDIIDLDITIKNSAGETVVQDIETDAIPTLFFAVPKAGKYTVELKNYDSERLGFCSLIILRDGAPSHALEEINLAIDRILGASEAVSAANGQADFQNEANTWALYGSILTEGSTSTITNVSLKDPEHAFVAAGDSHSTDIDLYLLDGNDNTLEKDIKTDPNPYFTARTGGTGYKIRVKNYDATGPSLVLWAVLDLNK